MTKKVRIENADTSSYQIVVETHDQQPDGTSKIADHRMLRYPTDLCEVYLTNTRSFKVREATQDEVANGLAPLTA